MTYAVSVVIKNRKGARGVRGASIYSDFVDASDGKRAIQLLKEKAVSLGLCPMENATVMPLPRDMWNG